jgi:hypothetical protein
LAERPVSEDEFDGLFDRAGTLKNELGSFRVDERLFDMLIYDVAAETAKSFGMRPPSRLYGA